MGDQAEVADAAGRAGAVLMRVEVWIRPTLMKRIEGDDAKTPYALVTTWDDPDSTTSVQAADRVYRVCTSGALDLTPQEYEWQEQWRAARNGYGFGVGDVVVADGTAHLCHRLGWDVIEWPRG